MKLRVASVVGILALSIGIASQIPPSSVLAQNESPSKKTEKGGAEGRVPAYYAQIGLSKEQRTKVLEVQASYAAKIDTLRKQIADMEAKRDVDVRATLTDDQKKKLDELSEAGKKKATETRTKGKPAEGDKKEDAPKKPAESK